MDNKKPRFPVREYLGKFESWLLIMKGSKTFRTYDKALERLFSMFPKKTGIEQFTSVDMADYQVLRKQQGASNYNIYHDMRMYYVFWRWLMEDKGLPVHNPARAFRNISKHTVSKTDIGLADITRLLDQCSDAHKRVILKVIQGGKCPKGTVVTKVLRDASIKAGLPIFDLYHIKLMTSRRLTNDIIKFYCEHILNSLPPEDVNPPTGVLEQSKP